MPCVPIARLELVSKCVYEEANVPLLYACSGQKFFKSEVSMNHA